ncbi:MAG TPA: phosphatase PAP2 family protein [Rhizobiaceae bacterium]|nr:phosphatase PAP2 family protein [Rhizobiaceae bacterium]
MNPFPSIDTMPQATELSASLPNSAVVEPPASLRDAVANLPNLSPFSGPAILFLLGVLLALAILVFHHFPVVDRIAAAWFFVESRCGPEKPASSVCGDFPLRHSRPAITLRQFLQYLPAALAAALTAASIALLWSRRKPSARRWLQAAAAFWTYVVSVGILINGVFKEFWGRPRPLQTDLFGGDFPFVPAGEISSHCISNCSFMSGEAAAAAWLVCLVPLIPRQYASLKPAAYGIAIALALATSILRMAFGAHYLSDVVIASLATVLIFSLLATSAACLHPQKRELPKAAAIC